MRKGAAAFRSLPARIVLATTMNRASTYFCRTMTAVSDNTIRAFRP
jgi:hypothetical protein